MPGPPLVQNAQVLCAHGGMASPLLPMPRVRLGGVPVVTLAATYIVTGCPNQLPTVPPEPYPCVSGRFLSGATRVKALGQPLLLLDSRGVCVPTGAPLLAVLTPPRVQAT